MQIVVKDRDTNRSRGFGFVRFATADEAANALSSANDTQCVSRTVLFD